MKKTKPGKNKKNSKHEPGSLSPEDRALWARVTHDVTPLTAKRTNSPDFSDPKDNDDQPQWSKPHDQCLAEPSMITTQYTSYIHGQAPGLDKRTQMRLRRGQVDIEARLDLHGMTQSEAHERMCGFLEASRNSGYRAVLVITGKGLRRDGQIGILRSAVPRWLNEPPLRDWIKAFDHAIPRDGGEGALYILLRRRK